MNIFVPKKIMWLDLETYSRADLKHTGAYRYAEDPSTEITLFGYAFDDEPAQVWDLTQGGPMPERIAQALDDPEVTFIAHNSGFDRTVLKAVCDARFGDPTRWWDSMIQAYSMSLPGALGALSEVLQLPVDKAKDKDGRRLVLKFCKPNAKGERAGKDTHPEDWARFVNYCRLDVEAMRETANRIPIWNRRDFIREEWITDQRINDRGINIDVDLVREAVQAADVERKENNEEMQARTDGAVETTGQREEMLKFILATYGVTLPDMQKTTLERRLNDPDLPKEVHDLIALRLKSTKASVKKFTALKEATCEDGRLRGTLQFMGAARTGRWSGRIFQPQNLPRGTMKPEEVDKCIAVLKSGLGNTLLDDVNDAVSNCIRGAVCAPEGKKLVVADLSNIEGRVLAWLAGEEWKIEAFKAFDAGHGPDLYKATYGRTFGIKPDEVTKKQRQVGKVLELGLGYAGGVGAFVTFSNAYRVDLTELAHLTRTTIDKEYWDDAESSYDFFVENKLTLGLSHDVFVACDAIKRAWRAAHPAITGFWHRIETACVECMKHGGSHQVGSLKVMQPRKGWLVVVLPSGRGVVYPSVAMPKKGERCAFTYAGVDQYSRQWKRIKTYAGKITENIVQATARDILMRGIQNAEAQGYEVVMHVHDEIISETPNTDRYSTEGLSRCMTTMPTWAEGLPLAAAGFEADRYRKD